MCGYRCFQRRLYLLSAYERRGKSVRRGRGECALPEKLKTDPRVKVMDKTNARFLTADNLGGQCDFVCIDVSFISLELILPAAAGLIGKADT